MNDRVYIYVLREAGSADVRYVGQTVNPSGRLIGHVADSSKSKKRSLKEAWIWGIMQTGSKIELSIIDECRANDAPAREIFWINHHINIGCDLTNTVKSEQKHKCARDETPSQEEVHQIEFLTVKEVAISTELHVKIIQRLIRDGKLPAVRVGKEYRISVDDFERFLSDGKSRNNENKGND